MDWIVNLLQQHSELAIFLTLAVGFWFGKLKFKGFSLGIVTSVLLIGVLVGQLNITIGAPLKSLFFLIFLFAIGYKVGPQFFRGLKKDGLSQVWFAIIMISSCLLVTWLLAVIMGYNAGEAAGLLSGAQTISAVIGVSTDTINGLNISSQEKTDMINIIPVTYAVTYIFGTAGSAWIMASLAPRILGGLKKVTTQCQELENKMGNTLADEIGFTHARRTVVFRAYKIENNWFDKNKTVSQLETFYNSQNKLLFVERIRTDGKIIDTIKPSQILKKGDEVVLSGRREFAVGEDIWIGKEVIDPELLDFPVEILPVMIHQKPYAEKTVEYISKLDFMHGVSIKSIKRAGISIPILTKAIINCGDMIELMGLKKDVENAAKKLGYIDRPSYTTDIVFVGCGILIGAIFGALTIHLGGVPINLSTSGGALIAGLIFGWWRSKKPVFGQISEGALWFMNNVGLNTFIAVVGISAGPSFVSGLVKVGPVLFIIGAIATTIPLIIGVLLGKYVFHFHPAFTLGCTAGTRTTTAALGAIQEAIHSETPALGYTITYAVGNTLLIIWGVVIVLLTS